MTAKAGDNLRRPPRRGARQWRYISPHRRGAGVALLVVLAIGVVAYWLLPRMINAWTRDEAVAYLRNFTGGQVSIREARFNLFGGIELRGVEVDVPASPAPKPFLHAETIVLRHRPWSLVAEGRLDPTEIVCIAPTVTLEYDDQRHRYTAEDLIASARRQTGGPARPESLGAAVRPVISIRDVRLRLLTGQALLNISMVPIEGGYRITLEEDQAAAKDSLFGTWRLDLGTGRLVLETSKIPRLAHTDALLPAQYAAFRKRYDIQGRVVLKGVPAAGSQAVLQADLDDVSLQLQPAEGGLGLTNVRGTLVFEANRVAVDDLSGQVPRAGDAIFRASGVYEGYDPNSGFDLHVTVQGMVLPDGSRATGWLADALKLLRESFRPSGKVDVQADIRRQARGPIELTGTARPVGMAFLYQEFPYAVDQVTGTVAFEAGTAAGDRVVLRDVIARHGPAEMTVNGEVDLRKADTFDVRVSGKNVPLDAQVRAAIPKEYQPFWDRFRPAGQAGANVHVWQKGTGQPQRTALQVILDGRAAMTYDGFPYRLDALVGTIRIDGSEITVESLSGRNGAMRCTIDGTLSGLATAKGQTNLTIEATALPLDANLMAALPRQARGLVAGLRLTGQAERASAKLRQSAQDPLDFRITANVKDVCLCPEGFPYAVTGVSGGVIVRPGRVNLEDLVGAHGKAKLELGGQAVLDGTRIGLDLHARGSSLALDQELLTALPEEARAIWRKLSPAGQADVDLTLQHDLPGAAKKLDYSLKLQARGMTVRYADFPYALSDVVGRAVVTPEGVNLEGITARHGEAKLAMHGRLLLGADGEEIHLAVDGNDVPIDRDLLAALPDSLAPLSGRFQPGGRCNLVLESLDIFHPAARGASSSRPATAPATATAGTATAATRPAAASGGAGAHWAVRGAVAVRDATFDLGLGHETLTGGLRGEAAQKGADLSVNALVALDSVILGAKQLTQLRGQLTKKPGSDLLRILDLTAQAYGGQVAGFAEIRLADPLQFGVSLAVQGIRLEELFKGDPNAAPGHNKVTGLLAGNVQLTAAGGKKPTRQASGVLQISEAELYKLPVMLGLLHVMYLAVPGDTAFTQGKVTYHLRNDKMIFDEIWLQGPALSIVGSGNMDMNSEALDLTFLTGPPNKLRGLAGLSELLDNVAREVAEIQVDGTLGKPRMRTVPLRGLDRLIREMLNPGRTK